MPERKSLMAAKFKGRAKFMLHHKTLSPSICGSVVGFPERHFDSHHTSIPARQLGGCRTINHEKKDFIVPTTLADLPQKYIYVLASTMQEKKNESLKKTSLINGGPLEKRVAEEYRMDFPLVPQE